MTRLYLSLISLAALLSATESPTEPSAVPEPTTYLMMAAGLGALVYVKHRASRNKK